MYLEQKNQEKKGFLPQQFNLKRHKQNTVGLKVPDGQLI